MVPEFSTVETFSAGISERSRAWTTFVVIARIANAIFFFVTAAYCILTYSSFAYQQFLRPHMVASLAGFVVWHHLWHWVMLGATAITLVPEWRTARGRVLAWAYLAVMAVLGVAVLRQPILPTIENDALGLWLAFAFLLPPIWLAVYDHVSIVEPFEPAPCDERRILFSVVGAGAGVWAAHALAAPLRFANLGDLQMSAKGFLFGAATSLALHAGLFAACGLGMIALVRSHRLGRRGAGAWSASSLVPGLVEYWLIAGASFAGCVLILMRVIFASLSFHGGGAWLLAGEIGLAVTLLWSSVAKRRSAEEGTARSALDAWFRPLPGVTSRMGSAAMLVVLPVAGFALIERAAMLDWDFLLQNLSVLSLYIIVWAYLHGAVRVRPGTVPTRPIVSIAAVLMLLIVFRGNVEARLETALTQKTFVPEYVLDSYAAADPSYRALRRLFWIDRVDSSDFYQFLRKNTLIQHVPVAPIDVDFVTPITKAPNRPNVFVFVFVIDSLRRDYLSVYNPAVHFTPNIARFAAESDAFQRAFTHYGGTGLSMPSIWAGGLVLHKEYVLPFARMNALNKLLEANGYRSLISMDHITAQLLDVEESQGALDRGKNEMQYDFCATMNELQMELRRPGHAPIFAHTRSLNLHVSKLTQVNEEVNRRFPGFQGPAAAVIARLDGCFGGFIDFLKRQGLYDNSIVVLTSDHGDSLGDARRWGHTYTIFPEIVRIPLIVHVPGSIRSRFVSDLNAVSFSTDLTPSLYALLGYSPASLGWMYGHPLFVPPGTDQTWRRKEPFLLASSYGPVYGLLQDNGRALYIADAMNGRDYLYEMTDPLRPVRVGVPGDKRTANQALIRAKVGQLAEAYHFKPQS